MNEVKGILSSVTLSVGRPDVAMIAFQEDQERRHMHMVDFENGTITFNGNRVGYLALIERIMSTKVTIEAVLHPRLDRYGLSSEAEFTEVNPPERS